MAPILTSPLPPGQALVNFGLAISRTDLNLLEKYEPTVHMITYSNAVSGCLTPSVPWTKNEEEQIKTHSQHLKNFKTFWRSVRQLVSVKSSFYLKIFYITQIHTSQYSLLSCYFVTFFFTLNQHLIFNRRHLFWKTNTLFTLERFY